MRSFSSTLPPGADVPEPAAALDDAVAHRWKVATERLGERLPSADPPAERPVELRHAGRQRLQQGAGLACAVLGQPHQVLGKPEAAVFGEGAHPHHAVHWQAHAAVSRPSREVRWTWLTIRPSTFATSLCSGL